MALTARLGVAAGDTAADQAAKALGELAGAGITVDSFSLGQPSLDEVFLALTGHDTGQSTGGGSSTGTDTKGEVAA
ncbi:ATP-binding cassette domain-containing protein OS=Streptomyces tendae OX=1932 GN=GUR47_20760 PE=4 SV=1 [Streptomyces tendae]